MPTLKDIAAIAKVNLSTVSKALNDNNEIKRETKEKIIEIAREIGYISNKNEKMYSKVSVKTIGLICPEMISNYYAQLANTIEEEAKKSGYTVMMGLTNFKYEIEIDFLHLFARKDIDGIVFITSFDERNKKELKGFKARHDIPVIQVAAEIEAEEYDSIRIDNYMAVQIAVEHLIDLGHRDICYIGEQLTQDRCNSFIEVMKKHDLKVDNTYIRSGKERFEEAGYKRMKEVLSLKTKLPTAIYAAYDDIAIGAMRAIFESGLKIPDDISIVSTDNINVSAYLYKSLSTVSSPVDEMGKIAMKIFLDKIEGKGNKVIQHILLKPELIIRETTAKVKETEKPEEILE